MVTDSNTRRERTASGPTFPSTEVDAVFGSLSAAGNAKTVEEMAEAVVVEAKRRVPG